MKKKIFAALIAAVFVWTSAFAAWDKTKPRDNELLKDSPALIRANWDAIETGTDSALLITNAKVSASAAIADTKLAQITTAGKVSGAALTLLGSVPAGGGTLPVANGGTGVTTSTGSGAAVLGTSPTIATPTITGNTGIGGTVSLANQSTDYLQAIGGSGTARVDATGATAAVNLALSTKGTGSTYFWSGGYGGTQTLLIDSAGLITTNGQVAFPATQNASAGANTLDDYEEGTWTPVIGGSGGTSGQTYSFANGNYVKIGKLVYVTFDALLSAKGTITGNVQIKGLPFTPAVQSSGVVGYYSGLATNYVALFLPITGGGTVLDVYGITSASSSAGSSLTTSNLNDTARFWGYAVYIASA